MTQTPAPQVQYYLDPQTGQLMALQPQSGQTMAIPQAPAPQPGQPFPPGHYYLDPQTQKPVIMNPQTGQPVFVPLVPAPQQNATAPQPAAQAPVTPIPADPATDRDQPPAVDPATGQPIPLKPTGPHPSTLDPNYRTGQLSTRDGHIFQIPPHPNTTFNEKNFLILLEGSISLTMEEKQRVIDAIPRLSIEQINELINIFTEERQKFAELEKEFADDVARLKTEREKEIQKTEDKKEETSADADATAEAEALKKQIMNE